MKSKKLAILALALGLVGSLAFAACGGKADETSSVESAGNNSESSAPAGGNESSSVVGGTENSGEAGGEEVQGETLADAGAWTAAINDSVAKTNATVTYTATMEERVGNYFMIESGNAIGKVADRKIYQTVAGTRSAYFPDDNGEIVSGEENFTSEMYFGVVDGVAFEWHRNGAEEWECDPYYHPEQGFTPTIGGILSTMDIYLSYFAEGYEMFQNVDGTYVYEATEEMDGTTMNGKVELKFVNGLLYSYVSDTTYTYVENGETFTEYMYISMTIVYDNATIGELPPMTWDGEYDEGEGGGNTPSNPVPPTENPSEGLEYTLINDGTAYSVGQGECQDAIVVIPSEYEGLPVTEIGYLAFFKNTNLTQVIIPDSVTRIDQQAFASCDHLQQVVIPNSVTSINYAAFSNCTNLTEIVIPSSVTKMGRDGYESIFEGCVSLTIYCETESKPDGWGDDWKRLYNGSCPVVWDCNNNETADDGCVYAVIEDIRYALKDGVATVVNQPDTITVAYIPETVFYEDSVYDVTSIGGSAFKDCSGLTEVVIPNSVTDIGGSAFYGCSLLTEIIIPDGVTSIGVGSTFYGCSSLTEIVIPDGVTSIGDNTFYGCNGLTEIVLPDDLTSIGMWAFYGCSGLTEIRIPKAVESIGFEALKNCYMTVYCEVGSTPAGWASNWIDSYKSIVWDCNNNNVAVDGCIYTVVNGIRYGIKDGVAEVALQTKNMTTANICETITYNGNSYKVTKISVSAFHSCKKLTSIIFDGTVEQWNALEKGNAWNHSVPATSVVCSDGEVTL